MTKPKLLSKKEAASELGIDPKTLDKSIAKGQIVAVRVGERDKIPMSEINRLVMHLN